MTLAQRCQFSLAVAAEAVGLAFVGFAAYFWIAYLFDVGNPLRHEYSVGIAGGLLYGFVSLLAATFLAISVKRHLPKSVFLSFTLPTLIVGSVLFASQLYSVATTLLG